MMLEECEERFIYTFFLLVFYVVGKSDSCVNVI